MLEIHKTSLKKNWNDCTRVCWAVSCWIKLKAEAVLWLASLCSWASIRPITDIIINNGDNLILYDSFWVGLLWNNEKTVWMLISVLAQKHYKAALVTIHFYLATNWINHSLCLLLEFLYASLVWLLFLPQYHILVFCTDVWCILTLNLNNH